MTVCGPSQCGKSHFIAKLIKNHDELIYPHVDKLLYLYSADQPNYDDIKKQIRDNANTSTLQTCEFLDCNKGIPAIDEIKAKMGKATLLVLDDLMVIATANSTNLMNLNNIAYRDSHHSNTSVIFVCQNLNFGSGKLRNCRVNSQYHVMFRSLTDFRDIEMIANNKKISQSVLHKILNDIGKKQYPYLCFDGSPKSFANTRVRAGIFPDEETAIYDTDKNIV
jgi:hypothetical protein